MWVSEWFFTGGDPMKYSWYFGFIHKKRSENQKKPSIPNSPQEDEGKKKNRMVFGERRIEER